MLTLCAVYFWGNVNIYLHFFIISQHWKGASCHKLHNQYHACWCTGDARSQGISSHGIDLVFPVYTCFSTARVNSFHLMSYILPQEITNIHNTLWLIQYANKGVAWQNQINLPLSILSTPPASSLAGIIYRDPHTRPDLYVSHGRKMNWIEPMETG